METAVPFRLCIATVFHVPIVVVQAAPFASVVPPTVAGRSDELIGCKFVQDMAALDAPKSVLERAEYSTNDVVLRVIIILCTHLVVERLV